MAETRDVEIPLPEGGAMRGYLALPDGEAPETGWPAMLAIHDIGGFRPDMMTLIKEAHPKEYELFNLKNETAVVIGGTGELCGAMAEGLAAAGANVVLVGRSEEKALSRIAKIESAGGKATFEPCEVDSKSNLEDLLGRVLTKFNEIDIVVNGAGTNSATPFLEIPEEEYERIFRINMKGVFLACQVFGKYLVD